MLRVVCADVALYAVLAFPVALGMLGPRPGDPAWWVQGAGLAVLAVAVAAGRARPLLSLLIVAGLCSVHGNFVFGFPVMAYLTGRRLAGARQVLWAFTGICVAGTAFNIARGAAVTEWFPLTLYLVLLGVLPWLAGRAWRQYQELVYAGWERAEWLEHQQRITAERERLRERARIARDMHDSLGHELALIAVRAGALQLAPGMAERHRAAAAELREGAARATEHLREIIGVLRDGDPPAAFTGGQALTRPAGESIAELVERAHASGIPVRLTGPEPPSGAGEDGGEPEPAPMVRLAAHRVVQEALTNAAKHAPGAPVTVSLARTGEAMVVSVVNRPPPPRTTSTGPAADGGGGRGLAGLDERVRLAGGTLRAGPTDDGGFRVRAELPLTPPGHAQDRDGPAPDPGDAGETADTPSPSGAGAPWRGGTQEALSESARRLARARRRVRRGLVTAIAVPAGLLAALSAVMVAYYVYATLNSVLSPHDYRALRIGAERAAVERVLPPRQWISAGAARRHHPEPPGMTCRYYRPHANVLGMSAFYRLCFQGDRLARKDVLGPLPSEPGDND